MKLKVALFVFLSLVNVSFGVDDAKTLATLKDLEAIVGNDVGNGHTEIVQYDVKKFNMGKEIAQLRERFQEGNWGDCQFDIEVGRRNNLDLMASHQLNRYSNADELLEGLHKRKKLKTILGALWNGQTGEGESCSIYYFEIYTTGGNLLVLNYELTD